MPSKIKQAAHKAACLKNFYSFIYLQPALEVLIPSAFATIPKV